ncbi:MAG TPA: DNA-directed RNA polymerase subunit alpha C-terminal domain-containing protein [bacterium]|nr:DNA-directed RNA polymerase subunit alpha C-terminal domain-containing protein [bacterium]
MKLVDYTEETEVTGVFRIQGTPQELEILRHGIRTLIAEMEGRAELLERIEEIEAFSIRTKNCLRTMGIETVRQLLDKTEWDLLVSRHFGKKSLAEVKEWLAARDLALKPEVITATPGEAREDEPAGDDETMQ